MACAQPTPTPTLTPTPNATPIPTPTPTPPPAATPAPLPASAFRSISYVSVTLVAMDTDGTLVKRAEVKAYSEDWGLSFPVRGFEHTDDSGVVTLKIPAGSWSFFVGGTQSYSASHEGQGYFVVLRDIHIEASTRLVAKPDTTILVSTYDLNGQVVNGSLRMMDTQFVPFVLAPLVGSTYEGSIRIHVSRDGKYDMAFLAQAKNGNTGLLLLSKQVEHGSRIRIEPTSNDTTQLSIRLYDRLWQLTSGYV